MISEWADTNKMLPAENEWVAGAWDVQPFEGSGLPYAVEATKRSGDKFYDWAGNILLPPQLWTYMPRK